MGLTSLPLPLDRLKPAAIHTLSGLPYGMNRIGFQTDGKGIYSPKKIQNLPIAQHSPPLFFVREGRFIWFRLPHKTGVN